MNAKYIVSALAAVAALSMNAYAADIVTSSNPDTITKSFGRAGGLAGSDRVSGLQTGTARVGVVYDADVAARTNMPRGEAPKTEVGVTYDADVAARTNMPRGGDEPPHKAAEVGAPKTN
jgi:hypothetical protein